MYNFYVLFFIRGSENLARKTKQEALETRELILEAALDIFYEKNYSTVTMTDIAAKVNMTKGAVYWHFKSKNDILLQILEGQFLKTERDFMDIYGIPESLEGLSSYYVSVLTLLPQDSRHIKIHTLMLRRHEWPEEVQTKVLALIKNSFEREKIMLEMLLIKAQNENKIRKDIVPAKVAITIAAVFYGLFILKLGGVMPAEFVSHIDPLIDVFRTYLEIDKK